MRLPQHLVESPFFSFAEEKDFRTAVKSVVEQEELVRINQLLESGLLPITSKEVLATIIGVNPGIIWSFIQKPSRYYRSFRIPKGKGERHILAPKVGLKIIQKWIGTQLQKSQSFPNHVYGFVPGRSHIGAAKIHTEARWVFSTDIENFFPSTPQGIVTDSLIEVGYDLESAKLIASLCCYGGHLAQGAPSSPVLSNLSMRRVDADLVALAKELGIRMTRYADDLSFSAPGEFPSVLPKRLEAIFAESPWKISKEKTNLAQRPDRLKVHGLLVHNSSVRLTKGYRNRIRAYRHVFASGKCRPEDVARISGHLNYASQVDEAAKE